MLLNATLLTLYMTLLNMGNYQIFYKGKTLLLRIREKEWCNVLPYKLHPYVDPGNTRLNVSHDFFQIALDHCSLNKNVVKIFLRRSSKWCGTKEDEAVEKCCTQRNNCPTKLKRKEKKGRAKNTYAFPLNSCDCEETFATCLKEVNNDESKAVLKFHFEIFFGVCLTYDHPYHYSEESDKPKTCIKNKKRDKKWRIRKMKHYI